MKTSLTAKKKKAQEKFIVIDGTDGTGKTTQVALLLKRLKKERRQTALADFPRYGLPSAHFVEQYLNGRYGKANEVSPHVASLFFAMDRYEAKKELKKNLAAKKIIISNRYVTANMAHQGSKIAGRKARRDFFKWLNQLEYDFLGLPRPTFTLILHIPAATAQRLVDKKGRRAYIRQKRDIHEADLKHLKAAERTYLEIADLFNYPVIECVEKGCLLPPIEIHEKIWQVVLKTLRGKR